jgi:hypothetical protein
VAEYALIDGYLDAFRTRVRWRKDIEDLVAEVEDHLYSTVERFEARGTDTHLAQRKTLDRFGDPDLMAEALASTSRGGIAVPTKFTVTAGTAAVAGAALWVAAAVYGAFAIRLDTEWLPSYLFFVVLVVGASAMTLLTTAALRERHGGLGWVGLTGLIVLGAGTAFAFIATWAIPVWLAVQGVGLLLVALAMWPLGVAPRGATIAYGAGQLVGVAGFALLRYLEVGTPDRYGDYPAALIGAAIGVCITAAGLLGIGMWLRNEEPAELDIAGGPTVTA